MSDYCLEFLVLGKPGIGKSTLVNGLVGEEIAKVSAQGAISTRGVNTVVEPYKTIKEDVTIKVWDTPGLLDPEIKSEDTLNDVKKICGGVDLILFCLNMNTTRLYDDGEETKMANMITDILGKEIWKKTLIVLVQANMFIYGLELEYNGDKLRTAFNDNIKSWKHLLAKKIPTKDFKVVPVGYFKYPLLFPGDKKTWLSRFWKKAYKRLPEQKQSLLFYINRSRISVLPHIKTGKEINFAREGKDDLCTQSKNQVPSTTLALREFSPAEQEIKCEVGDLSDIDPTLEKSTSFTANSISLQTTTAGKLDVSDEAPPPADALNSSENSHNEETPKAEDASDEAVQDNNLQTAVTIQEKETEADSLSLSIHTSNPERFSTVEPAKNEGTEEFSKLEPFGKSPASSEADHKQEGKSADQDVLITTQKQEESESTTDKEKKKPPPTKPKPKKLSIRSSPQQETPLEQKKVGKLAPELVSKFIHHSPEASSTISTLTRRRSNTTPSGSDMGVSSFQEKRRALTVSMQKFNFMKKHASYHSESDLCSSDVKEPTLKKSDSSLGTTAECHPKGKNVVASSNTPNLEPSTPTIIFNTLNTSIEEMKNQTLPQQPIIVSEGFWKKLSSTFSKFWKKVI